MKFDDTLDAEAYTQEPNSLWHNALRHLLKKRSACRGNGDVGDLDALIAVFAPPSRTV